MYLWGSPFFFAFFFCIPSYIYGVPPPSSSSEFPAIYLWDSPFCFFFRIPSCISGVHHSSSCAFPAISVGFTILLLLLRSQLNPWGSPFFFFLCIPSFISGVHHSSSSSAFPAISHGFTIPLFLLLRSQLDLWGSPFRVRFLRMGPFFDPTIEVVTFCRRGWFNLRVFLLPAVIHLGHECQDLLGPCEGMHVCTDQTSVYTLT